MSAAAYQTTQRRSEQPRSAEYRLMAQITGEMIAAKEGGLLGTALAEPLSRNRELWNVFSNDCASSENGLPEALRASIISLGIWVDKHTSGVIGGREEIDDLIDVNRSIMEGLAAA
ncbi:flagellar biosynthesis regulator FlaF [Erythrobacter aureus]|uniref:Flagellar biosynthesis regulatory protein FlaF n=1 Tax=Erythrobacter aureus TaxID=2182384 RepID=A0A345YIG1_9SPHN|nr:flagellar biosynthesis regulator FlaF [Erythrobacter aureus]AXK43713.1 flagellar biosynthesis regulatory protein FlaF [Erythrobacter aureus]